MSLRKEDPDYYKYYISPSEMQAKIQPLQVMMHQQGWQPKQMKDIVKSRNLFQDYDIKELYNYFGDDNMEYLLTNLLRRGGKL